MSKHFSLIQFCLFLCLMALASGAVLAQSCTPPPTCTATQASRWNGSGWECIEVGGAGPSGTMCGAAVYSYGTWQPASGYQACAGVVPGQGPCPAGYTLHAPYSAYLNWFYTCMKD